MTTTSTTTRMRAHPGLSVIQRDIAEIVESTSDFERLRGKRLLLTGGTGFIGTWLLESLAYLNDLSSPPCRVYVPTRDPLAFARRAPHLALRPEFVFLSGDITTFEYPDDHCDIVIHAAAPASPLLSANEPLTVGEIIVAGTSHVLEIAHRYAASRFLFVSSGAIYGQQPPDLTHVPEDYGGAPDVGNPRSTYGEAKRYAELLCLNYAHAHDFEVIIARPFTFVGLYQDLDGGFAVTDFIRDALRGGPLRINGDGTTVRSYCTGADAARAIWMVLFRGLPGRAYNVGSDEPISIVELARHVVRALDTPVEIEIARASVPDRLPDRYVPDITRLRQELGYRPHVGLDEALRQFITLAGQTTTPSAVRNGECSDAK